jgi:hypothetical protein
MRKPCLTLALVVLLATGLSLALPAEDLTETAYDESEGQPSEITPMISRALPSETPSAVERRESLTGAQFASPDGITAMCPGKPDGHRSAGARATLALLCTLHC